MKLSIIVPAYNEERTIYKLLNKVSSVDFPVDTEIVVVNDGSTDNTLSETHKFKRNNNIKIVSYSPNKGKGYAVRKGIEVSTGDVLVIQDADLEYDPGDLKRLLKHIIDEETEVVYGSRMLGQITGFSIKSHYYGNKILTFLTKIIYNQNITDMETCYKMMTHNVIDKIDLESCGFDFEPEITSKIIKNRFQILEVPISYNCRSFNEGKKISWKDGVIAIYKLFKYRFSN